MDPIYGEIAALSTALCWAFGSTLFTLGGKRIGSANVNRGRLVVAAIFLSVMHLVLTGSPVPINASPDRWFWLGLSGIVGFIIGDGMLFEAFVIMGPRLSMLMMSLVPIMSAILAWIFLREPLDTLEIFAIAITVSGICWVVADKRNDGSPIKGKKLAIGILCGIGGALGQTVGLVLSKKGLSGGFPALSGNLIRVICAVLILWLITALSGRVKATLESYRDGKAFLALYGALAEELPHDCPRASDDRWHQIVGIQDQGQEFVVNPLRFGVSIPPPEKVNATETHFASAVPGLTFSRGWNRAWDSRRGRPSKASHQLSG